MAGSFQTWTKKMGLHIRRNKVNVCVYCSHFDQNLPPKKKIAAISQAVISRFMTNRTTRSHYPEFRMLSKNGRETSWCFDEEHGFFWLVNGGSLHKSPSSLDQTQTETHDLKISGGGGGGNLSFSEEIFYLYSQEKS